MTRLPTTPKVLPPQYFLCALIGIGLTGTFFPGYPLPSALRWTGIPLILAGLALQDALYICQIIREVDKAAADAKSKVVRDMSISVSSQQ